MTMHVEDSTHARLHCEEWRMRGGSGTRMAAFVAAASQRPMLRRRWTIGGGSSFVEAASGGARNLFAGSLLYSHGFRRRKNQLKSMKMYDVNLLEWRLSYGCDCFSACLLWCVCVCVCVWVCRCMHVCLCVCVYNCTVTCF